ncbi:MAG: hypothetical protein RMJ45_01350 [Candidatus Calescibacterium sp.]|nr:hypothetical protein [Candidatus Calescibacterium sp.]
MPSKKCPDCNGTGRCKHCKGTGRTFSGRRCVWCLKFGVYSTKDQGSGVCSKCQGKGEV